MRCQKPKPEKYNASFCASVLEKEEEMMPTYQSVVPNDKWPARYTFSPATRVGILVFLSGTTGTDDEGNIVGPGDIVAQTRRIFEKFALILQSVGGNLSNMVETTDYVLSLDEYRKTAALRRELFKGPPWPAATGVVVAGLIREGALIEIKGIAAL
jgi:enamine deaminase RidA (YjgF/YER057c/UK114 family)